MPSGEERVLRRRIRSAQSTKKITRAMELIAASRIAKTQTLLSAARPYAELLTQVVTNLTRAGAGPGQPLLTPRIPIHAAGIIAITSDRGLAGGYTSLVTRAAEAAMRKHRAEGQEVKLYVAGKRGQNFFRYQGYEIADSWSGFSERPSADDARQIARAVLEAYEAGDVDQVDLVYTQFLSRGSQRVVTRRFIPLETPGSDDHEDGPQTEYEFEPSPEAILAELLPRYVESRLYSALLDAAASEHVARQRAMGAATENATELIRQLERRANRVRQENITTELVEITGSAAALEG